SYISGRDAAEVTAAASPRSRLLFLETIANPTIAVSDLPALIAAGHRAGLTCVVDNTFATPVLCRPIEHGADIVIHSATKYLGGHDDVTLGLVVSAREQAHQALWKHAVDLGFAADPFAAWLTLRGLKTLPLRMDRHCANAAHLARKLAAHPAVTRVHWPGLADHPDHDTALRLLAGFGGMVAFDLAGGREAGLAFVTGLRLAAGSGRVGFGRAGDGASPLDQDHVAPAAVQVADPLTDAHHAEALPLVQVEAGGVLREDAGVGGPSSGGLGGADQGLGQEAGAARAARRARAAHRE